MFPDSLKLITLSGTFLDGADDRGVPREGVIRITLPTPIRSEGDNVIIPPFELEIDLENGSFLWALPATTDPDWLPNTAEYLVEAIFTDDWRKLWWSFPLPYDTPGDIVDMADVGTPNVGTPTLTIRQGISQPLADGGYKGMWGLSTLYRTGDTVQHGSAVYGALKPSSAITPGTNTAVWKVYPSSGGGAVDSVNGQTGEVVLDAGDVGAATLTDLSNGLAPKAPLASPALTGTTTVVNLTQSGRYLSTPDVLTDAATIAVDASLGNDFMVTLGGNRTLGNPTNSLNGQKIMFAIRQDGAGNRILTLGSDYRLGTDISSVVLSTGPGKTDYLGVRYNGTDSKWDVIAFVKGY